MKFIDLFSGAGGLSIGLEKAGFEAVCAVEMNKDAAATYQLHHPNAEVFCNDVRKVDLSHYSDIDLLCGGPPCQPFSSGGLRNGANDTRDMIPAFIEVLEQLSPSTFIMENVPGLAKGERKSYLDKTINRFTSIGYNVVWKILSSADYGVPQKRKRLIVVGMKNRRFIFPEPDHDPLSYVTVGDVISKDTGLGKPNPSKVTYAKKPHIRPNPSHGLLFNGGGRPLDFTQPAPTILASAGGNKTHFIDVLDKVPEYHNFLIKGGTPKTGALPGARRLTVLESALLQSFPEDFTFVGSRSSQYRQVGNAVPPLLAYKIGTALHNQMIDFNKDISSDLTPRQSIQQELFK